ncbi:MAG: DNA topoisomerase III, partial [Alphaproteobacteria bacterium]|nr:DNA topoisomerase III [Alphaproteobacteria bacterium]
MRLYIAEKPSVAKAIAAELGQTGKGDGFITCGETTITWCFGHMLENAEPDEYTAKDIPTNSNGKKIWRTEDLPIIPDKWILKPKDDAKKQLAQIGKLIKEASEIVNAGDPDREGQLLVDQVLEHFNNKSPVKRFWVSAQDSVSVQRGLQALKSNEDYAGWRDAALARGRADWLIGMNLSRAYTLRAKRGGSGSVLSVGRVQTPTLALVVSRDREIEAFKAIPYHNIKAVVVHGKTPFGALWSPKDDQPGLDSEGRLTNTAIADEIVTKITGKTGQITDYKQDAKKSNQPLAFSLSDMTLAASNDFGYSADDVLTVCQSLYETHKLTSYPRTDCAFLPESQHADAARVIEAVKQVNPELAGLIDGADLTIKSRTWDDKKITAHHGIIPTMHAGSKEKLNEKERNIYSLIVRAYIAQFYPIHEYLSTTVTIDIEGEIFGAKGKVVTKNGWKDVFQEIEEETDSDNDDADQVLPSLTKGDQVKCHGAKRKDAKTKPPARFSEGTLIKAMENIHKYVTDPEHKKMLRDGDGIGTSATRSSIVEELKKREFLEQKGKFIVSSTLGRSVISALPEIVRSPVLTALYERTLKSIETGQSTLDAFVEKQETFIRDQVAKANDGSVSIAGGKEAAPVSRLHKCGTCSLGLSRRPTKKKGVFWWGCSG